MTSEPTSKGGPKSGMSLYANLLTESADAPGTISRAPVVFKQSSEAEPQAEDSGKKQLNPGNYLEII
jgi:splicing factor 45